MIYSLSHHHLWSLDALTSRDAAALIETALELKRAARRGALPQLLRGRDIALLSGEPTSFAALSFHAAAMELGARVAFVPAIAGGARSSTSLQETAQLLARLYHAVECQGMPPQDVRELDLNAGIPVYNGLGELEHPTRALADLMTLQELTGQPLDRLDVDFLGDAANPSCQAFLRLAGHCGVRVQRLEPAQAVVPLQEPDAAPPEAARAGVLACSRPGHLKLRIPGLGSGAAAEQEQAVNRRYMLEALLACTAA